MNLNKDLKIWMCFIQEKVNLHLMNLKVLKIFYKKYMTVLKFLLLEQVVWDVKF